LTALGQFTALAPAAPAVVTRLWQGPLDSEVVALATGLSKVDADITIATAVRDEAVATTTAQAPTAASGPAMPGPASTQGLVSNQAMHLAAGSADQAPVAQARANEQLSRGERAEVTDLRAREPNGRDCPNARNRASESTAGTK
jgi:hypothetical protein